MELSPIPIEKTKSIINCIQGGKSTSILGAVPSATSLDESYYLLSGKKLSWIFYFVKNVINTIDKNIVIIYSTPVINYKSRLHPLVFCYIKKEDSRSISAQKWNSDAYLVSSCYLLLLFYCFVTWKVVNNSIYASYFKIKLNVGFHLIFS